MSNTKTKTKMKSGTIAIIALSIVLVLSLLTTITLAYFTATRNVVTTIQFANGVKLQMQGAYTTGASGAGQQDTPPSNTTVTLFWKAAYGAKAGANGSTAVPTSGDNDKLTESTGTYSSISEKLYFEDLKVRVTEVDAYVAVRIAVRAFETETPANIKDMTNAGTTDLTSYVQPQLSSTDWTASTNGWFIWKNNASKMTKGTTSGSDNFNDIAVDWTINPNDTFAGVTIVCTVTVYASNTVEGLTDQITAFNTDIDPETAGSQSVTQYDTDNKVGYAKSYTPTP